MPRSSRRLFIGLMVDPRVRMELAAYQAQWQWPAGARITPPANFHLTLHFLGNVEAETEMLLQQALAGVRLQPLRLSLDRPGQFPKGIAFIQPAANAELDELHRSLAHAITVAGLAVDAQWQPHVTLARKAVGALAPAEPVSLQWNVAQFALAWSHDGRYEQLGTWPGALTHSVAE